MPDTTIVIKASNLTPQAFNQLKNDVNGTVKAFNDANKSAAQFESTTGKLSKGIIGVGGAIAGIGVAKLGSDIFQASLKMENLNKMLVATEGSVEKGRKTLAEYIKMAKDPGLALPQITQSMTVYKQLGLNAEFAKKLLRETSNELVLMGKGVPELERVNRQFEQMLGKGKPLREDLIIIAESLPNISKLVKDAFGTFDTEALIKRGVTSEKFLEGLVAQMEKAPRAIGGTQNSLDNFKDSLMQFEAALGKNILPSIGQFLDKLTGLMDSFNELPNGVKTALGTGTIGVLGGVGLLGMAGTVSFLVNQIKELTGLGGIKAVANVGAGVASNAVASAERAWVRNPAIAEGMAGAWVREGKAPPSAFMAGSLALQIATATIAAGTLVFAGAEIYKAFTRDFTAEEKKNIAGAPQRAWNLGMGRLQEAQMGKGNFSNMTVGELGTEDFINGLLEHMGLPLSARGLTLQQLKEKYGYAYPTQIYKEPAGPPEPAKRTLPPGINPEDLGFMQAGPFRPEYRDVAKAQTEMWMDNLESFKPTFGEIGGGLPVPSFTYDFLEYMKGEAAKSSIIASLEKLTPEMLGGSRGYREGIDLSGRTGFDVVKRTKIAEKIYDGEYKAYKDSQKEILKLQQEGMRIAYKETERALREQQFMYEDFAYNIGYSLSKIPMDLIRNFDDAGKVIKNSLNNILNSVAKTVEGIIGQKIGEKIFDFINKPPNQWGDLIASTGHTFAQIGSAMMGGNSGGGGQSIINWDLIKTGAQLLPLFFDDDSNDWTAYKTGKNSRIALYRKSAEDFSRNFEKGFTEGSGTSNNQDSALGAKLDAILDELRQNRYELTLDGEKISSSVRKITNKKTSRGEWA